MFGIAWGTLALRGSAILAMCVALVACGTQRSTQAFCDVLAEQKDQYLTTYDPNQLDGLSEEARVFGSMAMLLGATGEIPLVFRKLADVAPEQIRADAEAVAAGMEQMLGSAGSAATDPLGFAVGGLVQSLQLSGPMTRVEQFAVDNCDN